ASIDLGRHEAMARSMPRQESQIDAAEPTDHVAVRGRAKRGLQAPSSQHGQSGELVQAAAADDAEERAHLAHLFHEGAGVLASRAATVNGVAHEATGSAVRRRASPGPPSTASCPQAAEMSRPRFLRTTAVSPRAVSLL